MTNYLILKLKGPMQAWGDHSFEGLRPISIIPTRSGIIGLLASCMGFLRTDKEALLKLNDTVAIAVRVETVEIDGKKIDSRILTDFHTVKDARDGHHGLKSHETIITNREYITDASYSVAIWMKNDGYSLNEIENAIRTPVFTPFLGRRSCPLSRPLFEARVEANNELEALRLDDLEGQIYSENAPAENDYRIRQIRMRDVPLMMNSRQFGVRTVYIYPKEYCCVS